MLGSREFFSPLFLPCSSLLWQEDWGEKYTGLTDLGIFLVDFTTGRVGEVPGISPSLTPGQPSVSSDGSLLVYTGWEQEPRRLGMIYCMQVREGWRKRMRGVEGG